MNHLLTFGVPLVVAAALVAGAALNLERVVLAAGLALLMLAPVRLTRFSEPGLSGVAHALPEVTTYGVAAVVLALMSFRYRSRVPLPLAFVGLALWLAIGSVMFWPGADRVPAGFLQYLLAPVGFAGGVFVACFAAQSRSNARFLAMSVVAVLAVQCGLALAQFAGAPINVYAGQADMGWRVNGTVGHPNTLGKIVFFALLVLLPLTRSEDRRTRRSAMAGLSMAALLFAVSGGRANFLAGVAVVVLWGLLLPRTERGIPRGAYLGLGAVFGAVALVSLSGRFAEDPAGGSRDILLDSAMRILPRFLATGMGPNEYLTVLGVLDPAVAKIGLPVHNSFVLATSELGVAGALCLFLPWLVLVGRAAADRLRGVDTDHGRLALASFVPMILIAYTGKGMLADGILPLWFLVVGMMAQSMRCEGPAARLPSLREAFRGDGSPRPPAGAASPLRPPGGGDPVTR